MMLRDRKSDESRARSRLNLLLSHGGWRAESVVDQLAQILEPLGIESFTAHSGEEAAEVIRSVAIHIAIVDLAIPLQRPRECHDAAPGQPGGARILHLLRRLDAPPPTVIVRPPQPARRESARGLTEALNAGAFAVVDSPLNLETMLEVMRRVIRRHYQDHWPAA